MISWNEIGTLLVFVFLVSFFIGLLNYATTRPHHSNRPFNMHAMQCNAMPRSAMPCRWHFRVIPWKHSHLHCLYRNTWWATAVCLFLFLSLSIPPSCVIIIVGRILWANENGKNGKCKTKKENEKGKKRRHFIIITTIKINNIALVIIYVNFFCLCFFFLFRVFVLVISARDIITIRPKP